MKHYASPSFWEKYDELPDAIQKLADKNYDLLKADPKHPSLRLKKVGKYISVRVGKKYRALGVEIEAGTLWFWIGTHAEYDKLIK
ncbi:MAG: hypothetical protein JNK81_01770 [Anaerolineales bacterium]|nr:hypothetical protein [Anaerolineales bacterium]